MAQALTFQQGIITAVESGSDMTFDPDTLNPHYSYEDENNQVHRVWMLDGVTAYNELRASERAGVRGTALWRLGMEDPSIWSIWDATHADDADPRENRRSSAGLRHYSGRRRRHLAHHRHSAKRHAAPSIMIRPSDVIDDESYQSYPLSWRIEEMGAAPNKVALTFDDGPDALWTPADFATSEGKARHRHVFRDRRIAPTSIRAW